MINYLGLDGLATMRWMLFFIHELLISWVVGMVEMDVIDLMKS